LTKPLYFYNGTTFELVGPTTPQSPIAYQTSAPTAPATGDIWIDSDGDVDTYNRQLTRYYFVATAGQTSISGVDANGLTLAYVAGSEAVYVNGALQVRGQDYTATNGTSITGLTALAVNDVVEIFAYTAFTVANAYTKSETDGVAAAAAGLRMVVPTSVAVGSGSGSVDAIGNVTYTTASSISLNGVFTSTYDVYRIVIVQTTGSTGTTYNLRYRTSGTDNSSSTYDTQRSSLASASNTIQRTLTGSTHLMTADSNAGHMMTIDISNPFLSTNTRSIGFMTNGGNLDMFGGNFTGTTSFDGFTFYPTSGTSTGTIRVYGYKD
jgi:hypothetical protein